MKKKSLLLTISAVVLSLVIYSCAKKEDHTSHEGHDHAKEASAQTLVSQSECPVMGEEINKNLYFDYKDNRIYVCCEGCIAAVEKEPVEMIHKLASMGQKVEKIQ